MKRNTKNLMKNETRRTNKETVKRSEAYKNLREGKDPKKTTTDKSDITSGRNKQKKNIEEWTKTQKVRVQSFWYKIVHLKNNQKKILSTD